VPTGSSISADRVAALVLFIGFAAYGVHGHSFQSSLGVDVVGPGFFPTAVGVLGAALSALLLLRREAAPAGAGRPSLLPELRALLPVGLMLAYVLSLDFLGFPIATLAFLVLAGRALGAPTWLSAGILGILGTTVAVLLFHFGLGLRLPQGDLIRLW
jgi:hypothetical protein